MTTITGTSGNDTYTNSGTGVTINTLGGNDKITDTGSASIIDGGTGDDILHLDRSALTIPFTMSFVGGSTTGLLASDGTTIKNIEHLDLTTNAGGCTVSFSNLIFDSVWGGTTWNGGSGSRTDTANIDLSSLNSLPGFSGAYIDVNGVGNFLRLSDIGTVNVIGSSKSDTFGSSLVNSTLCGEGGDDTFYFSPYYNYNVVGGDGADTVIFESGWSDWQNGNTLDLNITTPQNFSNGMGGIRTITLTSIENVVGSPADDTIIGNSANNNLEGTWGNDTLIGGAGDDILNGGDGVDWLDGGLGKDVFVYDNTLDSTGSNYDTINGFNAADDKIALDYPSITGIDPALKTGTLSSGTFDADLTKAISNHLLGHHAMLFTPNAGDLKGQTFLLVDCYNRPGYADLVVKLASPVNMSSFAVGTFT